jgi:hypothetical protein
MFIIKQLKLQKLIEKSINKLKRLFIYYGSGRMVADVNGKPKGIVWFTICTGLGNFRLFPVGYVI